MKPVFLPVTAALAVCVVVLLAFLWQQNRVINGLHQGLASERGAIETQQANQAKTVQDLEQAIQDRDATIAQLRRELEVARAAAGLETERTFPETDAMLAEQRKRQQRRMVQERYGDLFGRLNLSPVALEELKRLLVELESPPSMRNVATAGSGTAASEAPRLTFAETHDRIYDLLGYEGYAIFDRYTRELISARPHVRRFAADAADAGYPLTPIQSSALAQAIFEVTDPQVSVDATKPGANVPDPDTGLTPVDRLVLARAADVLSAAQIELLRAFRIRERANLNAWRDSLTSPPATPEARRTESETPPAVAP